MKHQIEIDPEDYELAAKINEAYASTSWLYLEYCIPADPDEGREEERTERWVLPLTPVRCGNENVIFTAWCRHARIEKMVEEAAEQADPRRPKTAYRMHARRTFRLDRIEAWGKELQPFTSNCPWYEEILAEFPQVAQKKGLKMVYRVTVDPTTGEKRGRRELVSRDERDQIADFYPTSGQP